MKRIAIYAQQVSGVVSVSAGELVTAAKSIAPDAELIVCAVGDASLAQQLCWDGVSVIIAQSDVSAYQEDALSDILIELLKKIDADAVLIPATDLSRSVFARTAAALNVGMTGDCTRLAMEEGQFVQHKPAFGSDIMVSCVETERPAMVTVTTGIYPQHPLGTAAAVECYTPEATDSAIEVLGTVEGKQQSIIGAERIVALGRGAMEGNSIDLARQAAEKLSAVIGGTRPLVDNGTLPFEAQIGQTGCTVHPRICLMLGVSGAIQHTEGIRDSKLTIAVNTDPNAAVFGFADYGVVMEVSTLLSELIQQV